MSTVPAITPRSITGIKGLEAHPVYMLKLNGAPTPNLVVKGENAGSSSMSQNDLAISIAWGSKLMKNVQSSLVNTKIMVPGEVQIFKAAVQATYANDTRQYGYAFEPTYKWVKMPYVADLNDADVNSERKFKSGDTSYAMDVFSLTKFKQTVSSLIDDAIWLELGKVVAVDIFNGNNDRFNLTTGAWSNLGNVMFVSGASNRVVGLDTFDPLSAGSTANLNKRGVFPELQILIDAQKRKTFSEACARSVGTVLKVKLEDFATSIKLRVDGPNGPGVMELPAKMLPGFFLPFAPTFEQGLARGAADLKAYLQTKVRDYTAAPLSPRGIVAGHRNPPIRPGVPAPGAVPTRPTTPSPTKTIPQGILDRMKYLGW
jgi:hypothetical protein